MNAIPRRVDRHGLAVVPSHGVLIQVDRLDKSFGPVHVLRDVSAAFEPGRTTALIGPNAAGKSTLLKCMLGLVRPDGGQILVGADIAGQGDAYRRRIGYMPQAPSFPEYLTAGEVTRMLKDLRGQEAELDEELFIQFELADSLAKPVRALSGGTRQKLNAALAFLFRPEVLILDEPTAGLDPIAAGILKRKVAAARDAGATVIITSHIIAEMEEMADDVVVLLEGAVRYEGPLSRLASETGESRLERAIAELMRAGRSSP
jgi:Cu-processing system ATP-binding protein